MQLLRRGQTLSAVTRHVQASVSSVFRWWHAYRREGWERLATKPTPGWPPGLSPRQKGQLVRRLVKGRSGRGTRPISGPCRASPRSARRGAHLVFVDESGCLLIRNVCGTWASFCRVFLPTFCSLRLPRALYSLVYRR